MAQMYDLFIEWVGSVPTKKQIAAIDAAMRESDHNFPGVEGRRSGRTWKEPMGGVSHANERLARNHR